jgi:hypothetical protein
LPAAAQGTPQGRAPSGDPAVPPPNYGSCTPGQENFYTDVEQRHDHAGVDPNNPVGGTSTYHNFGTDELLNYAPLQPAADPSQRYSLLHDRHLRY